MQEFPAQNTVSIQQLRIHGTELCFYTTSNCRTLLIYYQHCFHVQKTASLIPAWLPCAERCFYTTSIASLCRPLLLYYKHCFPVQTTTPVLPALLPCAEHCFYIYILPARFMVVLPTCGLSTPLIDQHG